MVRLDRAAPSVRLGVVRGHAVFSHAGRNTVIVIERVILLAGDHDVPCWYGRLGSLRRRTHRASTARTEQRCCCTSCACRAQPPQKLSARLSISTEGPPL